MRNVTAAVWRRAAQVAALSTTPLAPSHYLALLRPLAAANSRRARVEAIGDETADTRTLTLRPGRHWRGHRAGQHVPVTLAIAGRLTTRCYSIASSPDRTDDCFTITVKAQGRMSRALHAVAVGSYLTIGPPAGDFTLLPAAGGNHTFITGGSGITPVMSMLRTLARRDQLHDVVHIHHARHAEDVIFGEELLDLATRHPGYRLTLVVNATGSSTAAPRDFTASKLAAIAPDWTARATWACGPPRLLAAVTRAFTDGGCADRLHLERFTAPLAPLSPTTTGGDVRFTRSHTTRHSDGRSPLLQVAEAAGVAAPHGCRMGICHQCDATLLAGCVRDLRTGETITEPGARVQVCVCAAAGDVELAL